MLSDEFDKKIKEAADQHHPPYDEKAWTGMKKLLDKHLPEEKDRKRRFIFILLFPLLLAGGWYLTNRFTGSGNKPPVAENSTQPPAGNNSGNITAKSDTPLAGTGQPADNSAGTGQPAANTTAAAGNEMPPVTQTVPAGQQQISSSGRDREPELLMSVSGGQKKQKTRRTETENATNKSREKTILPAKDDSPVPADNIPLADDKDARNAKPTAADNKTSAAPATGNTGSPDSKPPVIADNNTRTSNPAPAASTLEEEKKNSNSTAQQQKKKNNRKSFFFLALSAAPDVSFTGNDKPGQMKLVGGAGIGYTYKERFTLRTGFYSGRKVYTASPSEYHGTQAFYTYYPNLQKVEADCKVYEWPLLLSYHFGLQRKHSWFASAGVSSLIMKRETYNYFYKYNPAGPTVNKKYTIKDQNKHFFSLATISAGYQYHITKGISLTAEPYFKIPLTGVGAGKVKLNSMGVSFTLSVNPFAKGPKK